VGPVRTSRRGGGRGGNGARQLGVRRIRLLQRGGAAAEALVATGILAAAVPRRNGGRLERRNRSRNLQIVVVLAGATAHQRTTLTLLEAVVQLHVLLRGRTYASGRGQAVGIQQQVIVVGIGGQLAVESGRQQRWGLRAVHIAGQQGGQLGAIGQVEVLVLGHEVVVGELGLHDRRGQAQDLLAGLVDFV